MEKHLESTYKTKEYRPKTEKIYIMFLLHRRLHVHIKQMIEQWFTYLNDPVSIAAITDI